MGDLIRSALNNISSNWFNSGGEEGENTVEFVGQAIDLKGYKLRVEKVLAEGGFGIVFLVRDANTNEKYALKRLIAATKDTEKEIENEIGMLTRLQPHPHIMKFLTCGINNPNIYLLLCEYCGCGALNDLTLPLTDIQQMNRILYQLCLAIEQMHGMSIIHRDLKLENVLFDDRGFVKLCDFGSATSNCYQPDHNWKPNERSLLEDEMTVHTTPMYRPPEILDTYLNFPINTAMDIWALGCLVYCVRFGKHPFEDCTKLRIINCNYTIPNTCPVDDFHASLVKSCLKVDPHERLPIGDVIDQLKSNYTELDAPCVKPRESTPTNPTHPQTSPLHQQSVNLPGTAQPGFGSGFSGFTRYLRNTSNKVINSVQQSIPKTDILNNFEWQRNNEIRGGGPAVVGASTQSSSSSSTVQQSSIPSTAPQPYRPINLRTPDVAINHGSPEHHTREATARGQDPNAQQPHSHQTPPPRPPPPDLSARSSPEPENRQPPPRPKPPLAAPLVGDLLNLSMDDASYNRPRDEACTFGQAADLDSILNGLDGENRADAEIAPSQRAPSVEGCDVDLLIDATSSSSNHQENRGANSNIDLLNDIFFPTPSTASGSMPAPPSSNGANLPKPDLLFGSTSSSSSRSPPLIPSASASSSALPPFGFPNSMHRNTSTPNLTKLDPQTQLDSFMSKIGSSNGTVSEASTSSGIPRVSSYSTFQPFQQSQQTQQPKPDYTRNHFVEVTQTTPPQPAKTGHEFEDLLSGFPKKSPSEPVNRTLGEMRKKDMLKDGKSPTQLKVMEWKENKTRNIRALLSSLHKIVWSDCKWEAVGMHQLTYPHDVRKMYYKACLAIHPDKIVGSENEELAKLIFIELNDAWAEFDRQNNQG